MYYELNTCRVSVSVSLVYYSDRAVGSTSEARVSIPDMGKRFFSSPKISDLSWDPPSLIFNQRAPEALFLGIKRLGPEAGHSRSSSPKVNEWSSTSIAPYAFMTCTRMTLALPF